MGDKRGISEALELFGLLYARNGESFRAVELFAAASRIRQDYTYAPPPARLSEEMTLLESAKNVIGDESYAKAWSQGISRSMTELIESVVEVK